MHRDELVRIIGEERRQAAARWHTLAQARANPGLRTRFAGFLLRVFHRVWEGTVGALPRYRQGEFRVN